MRTLLFYIGYLIGCISKVRIIYDNVFIFHSYAVGGAEIVHLNILEDIKKQSLIIFLNSTHKENLLNEYTQYGSILNYGSLDPYSYAIALGRLSSSIQFHKKPLKLFGYAIQEFYIIAKQITSAKHDIIDIIHADNLVRICPPILIPRINTRIVIDENTLNSIQQYYKDNRLEEYLNRIKLIYNSTEIPEKLEKTAKEYLEILFVGRDSYEKRIYLFEQIARKCLERQMQVKFSLVGSDRAVDIGGKNFYNVLGLITDKVKVNQIYRKSDLVLVTSTREGFPMVIMEAMANGCIPISTSVGGIPYHIKNGENGFLVDDKDETEIVNSFVQHIDYLVTNRSVVNTLSQNTFNYAEKKFSKSEFAKQYKALLS